MLPRSIYNANDCDQNKIAAAVDVRMRAQNGKRHYQDKFQAEKKTVDEAEAAAEVVVEEFNVSFHLQFVWSIIDNLTWT